VAIKWKACAVCGYPLERERQGGSFGHFWRREDHPAVPVDVDEIDVNQRCDFCSAEPVTSVVLARKFDLPNTRSSSVGPWAACQPCGDLVARNEWGRLVTRVKQNGPEVARRTPRRIFVQIYDELQRNSTGVVLPWSTWLEINGGPTVDVDEDS
jgi:hypothetical protein